MNFADVVDAFCCMSAHHDEVVRTRRLRRRSVTKSTTGDPQSLLVFVTPTLTLILDYYLELKKSLEDA